MDTSAETLVRRWFKELWGDGNEAVMVELMAANAVVHGLPTPDGKPIVGPAGFLPLFRQFKGAFPDMTITMGPTVTHGDWVCAFCTVNGTHAGPGLGEPTQLPVRFTGITMARARNGQLVEGWNAFDFLGCYQQIHVMPPLPPL